MIRRFDCKVVRIALAAGIVFPVLSAGRVAAANLVTPPLLAPTSQQRLVCIASNVDKKPGAITVTIVAGDGTTAAITTCDTVAPAGTCAAAASGALTGHCAIDAKKKTRGALWLQDAAHDGIPITSVPATK